MPIDELLIFPQNYDKITSLNRDLIRTGLDLRAFWPIMTEFVAWLLPDQVAHSVYHINRGGWLFVKRKQNILLSAKFPKNGGFIPSISTHD